MRLANEQFVELFDCDLVTLPRRSFLPEWFTTQLDSSESGIKDAATLTMGMMSAIVDYPLVSPDVIYSHKESLIDDDDD